MKFPFEFGITLVFRLIFPGLVLAVAVLPLAAAVLKAWDIESDALTILSALAVILGWLVVMADQPIYMLYEGRRYWPGALKKYWMGKQRERLNDLIHLRAEFDKPAEQRDVRTRSLQRIELTVQLLAYPLDLEHKGEHTVEFPTRLGNLINAYETYSHAAYGMDAIFYWPRIWIAADKDTRDTLDQAQAIADSALYVSFALACAAPILLLYGVLELLPAQATIEPIVLPFVPTPASTALLAVLCAVAAYAVYRIGLHPQAQYGNLFKAVIDQSLSKLDFVTTALGRAIDEGTDPALAQGEKYLTVSRFLRYHKIKPSGQKSTWTPEAWRKKDET